MSFEAMSFEEFDAAFDAFRATAFRLETLPRYSDEEEDAELALFLAGKLLPERSARTVPWLKRVADTTVAGKRWRRVHIVRHPLTDYLRFELVGYEANVEAGEDVRIADRDAYPELAELRHDFWLFDAETPEAFVLLMSYDDAGRFTGFEQTTDLDVIRRCQRERDLAVARSVPLHDYTVAQEA
jgi:hypothetical protein